MTEAASLTADEARERAAVVEVGRYDISVDLRDLLDGEVWHAESTISFRCLAPGASTFVDCVGEVHRATLNGVDLDLHTVERGRIPLTDLSADNVLVVSSSQDDTGSGAAMLRTVDPSDQLVYVWTSFEPDGARRAWACFDQPDLKAPHRFSVTAPASWTVTSNGAPSSVTEVGSAGDAGEAARLWEFPDTPPLSTYVVVVNAGPFHEIREHRGGHDLGLYCRQSLRRYLERDAEELFRVTEQGLAFFGDRFGLEFPQERYDQVFVPDMGGAMENWGCVTWTDSVLFRSEPTHGQRSMVAMVLLHEMAHMWFGDLVTMRWWDDLWLNEAFASWAATWAAVGATEYTDGWATFLAADELRGYAADMGPASHPIRGDVRTVAEAMASFDAITYVKGQAVLRQLMAFVGEDAFVAGLRAYFRTHAWGNTELQDLVAAIGTAAGRDLDAWSASWFDRAGTDTLSLVGRTLLATSPDGGQPRRHRLDIGTYVVADGGLTRVGVTAVETTGTLTSLDIALPDGDLHLLNEGDLTFASVRTDEASLDTMLRSAGRLPDPLARAMVVSTAWDMLSKEELSTGDVLGCLLDVLGTETSPGVVEPFLAVALRAAEQWSPRALVPRRLALLAEVAARRAAEPEHRTPALRTLAWSAVRPEHFELLDVEATADVDLAWRVMVRRASLGVYDEAAVARLLARDPDPDAASRALGVLAARPDMASKEEAWEQVFTLRSVPMGPPLQALAACFWRPVQHDLMVTFAHRFLDELEQLRHRRGGLLAAGSLLRSMSPTTCDESYLDRARTLVEDEDTEPAVRSALLGNIDTLRRVLRARS